MSQSEDDERDRPDIDTQVVFKGDYNEDEDE